MIYLVNFFILIVSICLVGILIVDFCWYNTFKHLGFLRFVFVLVLLMNIVRLKFRSIEYRFSLALVFNIIILFISIYNIVWLGVIPFGYSYNASEMTVDVETLLFFHLSLFVLAIIDFMLETKIRDRTKIS